MFQYFDADSNGTLDLKELGNLNAAIFNMFPRFGYKGTEPPGKTLTLYLIVFSADNLGKQFGPRSGPTKTRVRSGSKLFDNMIAFLKEFFEKVDFEKNQQIRKKHTKLPNRQRVKGLSFNNNLLPLLVHTDTFTRI